jgi:hypothetical protein
MTTLQWYRASQGRGPVAKWLRQWIANPPSPVRIRAGPFSFFQLIRTSSFVRADWHELIRTSSLARADWHGLIGWLGTEPWLARCAVPGVRRVAAGCRGIARCPRSVFCREPAAELDHAPEWERGAAEKTEIPRALDRPGSPYQSTRALRTSRAPASRAESCGWSIRARELAIRHPSDLVRG